MTSTSPPHSPSSSHQPYQHFSDADHCFPPSTSSTPIAPGRARSGSRTYKEVQEDERRERERERESSIERDRRRAEAENALEGRISDEALREQLNRPDEGMSMSELRAEMETLLSLRRRSMSQPAAVDPDLPPTAPPTSAPPPSATTKRPQLTLTITPPTEGPGGAPISPTAPSPAETGTLVRRRSSVSQRLPSEHPLPAPPVPSPSTIPAHIGHSPFAPSDSAQSAQDLFWLPASLHPELAPQEFKAFIREQTRPEALARRSSLSPGTSGRGVGRRASLLRGEYKPRQDDGVGENEGAAAGAEGVKRTASDGGSGRGSKNRRSTLNFEELTIKDLQRLEELAAKAEAEGAGADADEGERLGRVLRRSLSLNPHRVAAAAAAAGATFGSQPLGPAPIEEEALSSEEAPIIVPPPGQILRRNARTKIRKGSTGEWVGGGRVGGPSGGSRFGSRRTRSSTSETGIGLGAPSSTEDDAISQGDVSFESMESEEVRAAVGAGGYAGEGRETLSPVVLTDEGAVINPSPSPSPPSSDNQHIEVAPLQPLPPVEVVAAPQEAPLPPIPHPQVEQPYVEEPLPPTPEAASVPGPPLLAAPVVFQPPPQPEPPQPELPPRHAIAPSSAEYDWATHNLQYQQPQPIPPPPPPEPQYTVHPGHSPRQPFSDVPPPQAVPVPLPERKESPSPPPSRPESPKPSGKEKKSGWSRLLGKDDDKKKKSKGKEKEKDSGAGESEKEKEKESSSSGFFGGLFGRKKADSDHAPPPAPAPAVAPEARMPPPPPTASGALLPNGRYANFYRLPIHVERAVYRLSHIKLANPRRPLYEQVLISNLMFWYLGLIQKPVQPPPAAQPVPIPGMRNQQQQAGPSNSSPSLSRDSSSNDQSRSGTPPPQQKRGGLNKPGRGGRTAETPMRTPSYEVQNQQLAQEQQQHYRQQQHQQLSQSHPQPSHSIAKSLFAPPLSSSSTSSSPAGDLKSRSPDRTSAPAQLYPSRTPQNSVEDDDDDRPLAQYQQHPPPPGQQQAPYRESYPQSSRPTPVAAYPSHDSGFQVTSRSRRVSGGGSSEGHGSASSTGGGGGGGHLSAGSFDPQSASPVPSHQRRPSAVSDKSFDAGEIYEAYAPSPNSPSAPQPLELGRAPPQSPPRAASPTQQPLSQQQQLQPGEEGAGGSGKPPLLGTVAPRGSSLRALVGEKGKKAAAAVGVGGGGLRSR